MSIWSRNFKSRAVIILYLVPLLPYIIERGTHFVEVFFKLALTLVPLHCNPYGQQFQWVAKHLFSIYQPYMSELQAELRKSSHPTHTGNVLIFLWGLWSTTNRRSCPPLFFCFLIGLDQLFSCFCCCSKKSLQHPLHDSCSHLAVSYAKLQCDCHVIITTKGCYLLSKLLLATQAPEKLLCKYVTT